MTIQSVAMLTIVLVGITVYPVQGQSTADTLKRNVQPFPRYEFASQTYGYLWTPIAYIAPKGSLHLFDREVIFPGIGFAPLSHIYLSAGGTSLRLLPLFKRLTISYVHLKYGNLLWRSYLLGAGVLYVYLKGTGLLFWPFLDVSFPVEGQVATPYIVVTCSPSERYNVSLSTYGAVGFSRWRRPLWTGARGTASLMFRSSPENIFIVELFLSRAPLMNLGTRYIGRRVSFDIGVALPLRHGGSSRRILLLLNLYLTILRPPAQGENP